MIFSEDIGSLRKKIKQIIDPIASTFEKSTKAEKDFLFTAERTDAGNTLPPYYLIYFLFVDLLGYKKLGRFEKVAWSIPIDYNGTAFLLEHRKLGMGLFAADKIKQETECTLIVKKINKAVKTAQPYFEWIAKEAAKRSDLNVINHSHRLYGRYEFLVNLFKNKLQERNFKKQKITRTRQSRTSWSIDYALKKESEWLALSAIEAFYSFTEHIFIHVAILKGLLLTGEEVANLANKDWASKFKFCYDLRDKNIKYHYDQLAIIKKQIRNYTAHGAFGKNGEAFLFHSGAGAVPLLMPHQKESSRFSIQGEMEFKEEEAINALQDFMYYYWESKIFPEVIYIQSNLPSILPYALNSTYKNAMLSIKDMESFVEYLAIMHDGATNMDW